MFLLNFCRYFIYKLSEAEFIKFFEFTEFNTPHPNLAKMARGVKKTSHTGWRR
jgi:hypothetical protein